MRRNERMNITIVDTARTMLINTKLDKSFWGEAVRTSVYLINRRSTAAIRADTTPAVNKNKLKQPANIWLSSIFTNTQTIKK